MKKKILTYLFSAAFAVAGIIGVTLDSSSSFAAEGITYQVLEGADSKYVVGSGVDVKVLVESCYTNLIGVKVDGEEADYTEAISAVQGVGTPTSEAPATEEATSEAPATEEATSEAPATEEATSEAPATEEATSEAPATEEATSEAPATEEATSEAPATEEATSEAPATEEATSEAPATEEATSEAPVSEEPTSEAPVSEEPTSEAPVSEEPTSEPPMLENYSMKNEKQLCEVPKSKVPVSEATDKQLLSADVENPATEPVTKIPSTSNYSQTEIYVKSSYLETLETGAHTFTFVFESVDGMATATAGITVEAPQATAEPTNTPQTTVEPTNTPEATVEPTNTPEATVEPTNTPETIVEPTNTPTVTVEPTNTPTVTAEPTNAPTATAEPTDNGSGKVSVVKATIKADKKNNKLVGTITGDEVTALLEKAGTKEAQLVLTLKNGKKKCVVKVDAQSLQAGEKLTAAGVDTKTGAYYLLSGDTVFKVNKNGGITLKLALGKTYVLLTKSEMASLEDSILKSVKLKKTSFTMKKGKKAVIALKKKADTRNVKKIVFTSDSKTIAAVNGKGRITAKEAGETKIQVKVTLKNGAVKKFTCKVTVK